MDESSPILPRTAPAQEALREALAGLDRGRHAAMATVVDRQGSSPATPGQKLAIVWDAEARVIVSAVGTVGGGAVEQAVLRLMREAVQDPAAPPKVHKFRLGPSLGMCCGGSTDILVEVMRPGMAVLLVGAGHVGLATSKLLADLGFRVALSDERQEATADERVVITKAAGVGVVHAEHDDPEVMTALAASPKASALVVMTHDHQLDQRVIEWGLARGFAFVGGVGSRAKAERTRQRLAAKGVAEADIERVRMPVGVSVGARRPMEIAVAIAAELVQFRAKSERLARALSDDIEPSFEAEVAAANDPVVDEQPRTQDSAASNRDPR